MSNVAPWIDPELVAAGELLKSRGLVPLTPGAASLAEVRAAQERISAFLVAGSVPLKRVRDLELPGPHGRVPCRLYLPDGVEQPRLLVYAHGGSFALGSLSGWDAMLRDLVRASGVAALSVGYRPAPEHRFPVAFDEVLTTIRFVVRDGRSLGVDATPLAAGGDSAGANLALAAALALRDAHEQVLAFLLLIYGVYSTDCESDSWRRLGTGADGLSRAQVSWVWENYLVRPEQRGARRWSASGDRQKGERGGIACMQRYILGRLLQSVVSMLVVSVVVFALVRLSGDPVAIMMPAEATKADIDLMRAHLGLDRPWPVQYWRFLTQARQGDFGRSVRFRAVADRRALGAPGRRIRP